MVTDDNGEPLFVGKDICEALGYKDPTTAMRSHCRGVQKLHPIPDSMGRAQYLNFPSPPRERQLSDFIGQLRKPKRSARTREAG